VAGITRGKIKDIPGGTGKSAEFFIPRTSQAFTD
jgi:hypothetical protein